MMFYETEGIAMKKICAFFMVLSFLLTAVPVTASQIQVSKSDIYDKALTYDKALAFVNLFDDYETALDLFTQLGSYKDSPNWKMYCMGKVAINNANELEMKGYISEAKEKIVQAVSYFEFLSPIDFNGNSKKLYIYCTARLDEYGSQEISQAALDKFATLIGTEDSMERYIRLSQGIPLPTQAPYSIALPHIAAHASQSVDTYWGPGKRFLRQEIIQVNQYTELSICGKEGDYYLIEAETGKGKIRCWALARKIQKDSSDRESRIGTNGWRSTLNQTTSAYYGPGEQYLKTGFYVRQGTMVTAYDSEGKYTMIECDAPNSDSSVRIWVSTDCLQR